MSLLLPWLLVKIYRMVPAFIRGCYPGFTTSTSHLFQYGDDWNTLFHLVALSGNPHKPMPGPYPG